MYSDNLMPEEGKIYAEVYRLFSTYWEKDVRYVYPVMSCFGDSDIRICDRLKVVPILLLSIQFCQ
jgi:hypothetical protein